LPVLGEKKSAPPETGWGAWCFSAYRTDVPGARPAARLFYVKRHGLTFKEKVEVAIRHIASVEKDIFSPTQPDKAESPVGDQFFDLALHRKEPPFVP